MTSMEQQFATRARVRHETPIEEATTRLDGDPISAALDKLEAEARRSGWTMLALLIGVAALEAKSLEERSLTQKV